MKPSQIFTATCYILGAIAIVLLDIHFFRSGVMLDSWNPAEHSKIYQALTALSFVSIFISCALIGGFIFLLFTEFIPDALKKADEEWEKMQGK